MDKDFVLRKSRFGGFRKSDVINYIEKQKTVEYDLRSRLAKANEESKKISQEIEMLDNLVSELKKECQEYKDAFEKQKSVEVQLGHVIMDARKYSDQIIKKAKEHIRQLSDRTEITLEQSSDKLALLCDEIEDVAEGFNKTFADLLSDLHKLLYNLKNPLVALPDIGSTIEDVEEIFEVKAKSDREVI